MKRNTKKNNTIQIILIGLAAYFLYKKFSMPKGIVTPGELTMTSFNDVELPQSPNLPQTYVDTPINYYQILKANDDVLSGVKSRPLGYIPLTI